uniref:Uncharacterized protein n=1 Tax=Anolis carolinensis TaxID=28377 RepID=A0A803SY42_ANOCA
INAMMKQKLDAEKPVATNGTSQRQTLKMMQLSITTCLSGKLWNDQLTSKASKLEAAVQTEYKNTRESVQGSELTTKGKTLFEVLQASEKLHKELDLKEGETVCLKGENKVLAERASHVQYMVRIPPGESADELPLSAPAPCGDMREASHKDGKTSKHPGIPWAMSLQTANSLTPEATPVAPDTKKKT